MVIVTAIFSILLLTLALLIIRTLRIRTYRRTQDISRTEKATEVIKEAPGHLSEAVRFASVAGEDAPFQGLLHYLQETYPLVHTQALEIPRKTYARVFRIEGSDTSLLPALLCAHLDVVPASEEGWEHPPFSGAIEGDYIWGRGSFDDKSSVIAILETFERILRARHQRRRTWYIALGSDEEVRGKDGGAFISSWFLEQKIRFAFVLDEGGAVAQGFIPQVRHDIAVIGLSEKASMTAKLSVEAAGGHSSTPSQPTSVGILARAIARIEQKRLKGNITYPVKKMLEALAIHSSFPFALIVGNPWLFRPLIISVFSSSPTMNALVRSTATVTMVQGAQASNIVPSRATAVVNIRALPGESTRHIEHSLRKIIADERVKIEMIHTGTASRVSPAEGEAFEHIARTIETVFPSAVPVPYLMSGASDALHYEKVSDYVYRFTPAVMNKGELDRMHSENERFSIENLHRAIEFYTHLVLRDS
ncbi:MAG: M20/M25/M40 family metallo-hydrolase [Sphaerochaetaceae bacterium]|nr:M20/M25/M40 family metallo-hydrolase [Sphaerochaetaceae bacterium]